MERVRAYSEGRLVPHRFPWTGANVLGCSAVVAATYLVLMRWPGLEARPVTQDIPIEVGQEVAPGTSLALIAEPNRLRAEVRIPATQAREIQLGQVAHVDTRNGVVDGHVVRIDPTVRQGTVQVDIELSGALPPGARPDLSIEGRVDIEVLDDVLFVDRPASAAADNVVELFRVEPSGDHATRVEVRLGRASVRDIEVLEGLAEGDRIVISDTRRWDKHDRLRFK